MKNKQYSEKKNARADMARQHTRSMEQLYFKEITNCVDETRFYDSSSIFVQYESLNPKIELTVMQSDTVSAIFNCVKDDSKLAVLNFASYKHPGGGFIVGSNAQEENLCYDSFLYNVLKEFDDTYYYHNRRFVNNGLYKNRALYNPKVSFFRNGERAICDVITCAAPNYSAAADKVTKEENDNCLKDRIRFVLKIAANEKVDTFIVGAWGCGVFKQDPYAVAQYFIEECQSVFNKSSIHLVFAIINTKNKTNDNLTPFVSLVNEFNQK